jgi:hypothetical protein
MCYARSRIGNFGPIPKRSFVWSQGKEVMLMPELTPAATPDPTSKQVEALAREMVEDRWPYTYSWATTPRAEQEAYLRYARMVLNLDNQ